MKNLIIVLVSLFWASAALSAIDSYYEIDYAKSQITFLAKSRMVNAPGAFRAWKFIGAISKSLSATGSLNIDCNSIDTDNERRDKHLQGEDFFNCAKFPIHQFHFVKVASLQRGKVTVEGTLAMHGVTQSIQFSLERRGSSNSLEYTGTFSIDRQKFGITYNSALNPIEKDILITLTVNLRLVKK